MQNVEKLCSQIFVAILTKINCFIETPCRNLKKSAKIAKVTGNFIATKKTPRKLSQELQE